MLEAITAVFIFIYHCICEYLLFILVDLFFKQLLNRAGSERELGVLWAMEGSVLLLFSLVVILFSHRPLVLGFLTLLTVLYSLHKCDDSLKDLAAMLLRCLRWADSRFFAARCFARRHWRRWRLPGRYEAAAMPPPPPALARRTTRLAAVSPRMGPAQLFSPSSLALTDPRRRLAHVTVTPRPTRQSEAAPPPQPPPHKKLLEYAALSWQLLLPLALQSYRLSLALLASAYRCAASLATSRVAAAAASVRTPRGLRRLPQQPLAAANPLVMALAHCPLLHAALNRARPHPDCTVGQEAVFAALLPVVNALAAAGAEVEAAEEAEEEEGGRGRRGRMAPVDGLELRLALHRLDDRQRSLADLTEWLLKQLHMTCRDVDRRPRLVSDLKKVESKLLTGAAACQEELLISQLQLSQLAPVPTLSAALRPTSGPHAAALRDASAAALASEDWRCGGSELRHLLALQAVDLSLCAACGRPAAAFEAPFLLRLPAQAPGETATSLTALTLRALAGSPRLCNTVTCKACGASAGSPPPLRPADLFSHGLLSPICVTPTRGAAFLPATPAATQTSTPVGGWRCRGDGCCRRLLRRLPACLLLALPPGAKVDPPTVLDIDADLLLAPNEDSGKRYVVRAIIGDGGVAFCRLGNRQEWFEFADELVRRLGAAADGGLERAWSQRGMNSQERVLLLERTA